MDVSIVELLSSGLKLMCIGMAIVFFFLLLLVGVIQQTHAVLRRLELRSGMPLGSASLVTGSVQGDDEQELIAAIAAAIHQYEQP